MGSARRRPAAARRDDGRRGAARLARAVLSGSARVVLLDVDGVLDASVSRGADGGIVARVPDAIAARVARLAQAGAIVWATSWQAEVRTALAQALGLPASTPSIAIRPAPDATTGKREAIDRWLRLHEPDGGWAAVVWLDDAVRDRETAWAAGSPHPLHVVRVDAMEQLTDADVDAALALLDPPPSF